MTRRGFITSTLQALALVGAVKLGLGNMTAEDVLGGPELIETIVAPANAKLIAYSPITMEVKGWSIDGKVWTVPYNNIEHGDIICEP